MSLYFNPSHNHHIDNLRHEAYHDETTKKKTKRG